MTQTKFLAVVLACLGAEVAFGQTSTPLPASPAPAAPTVPGGNYAQPSTCVPAVGEAVPTAEGPPRFWADADYLLGWVRGDPLPALVTTSPAGTPRAVAGVLKKPTTTTLFGPQEVNTGPRSGMQADLGFYLDHDRELAFEAGFFFLQSGGTTFNAVSDGNTILARPLNDVSTGMRSSALVAFPGASSGAIVVDDTAKVFYGGNFDFRENVYCCRWCRVDALVGYRALCYDEKLTINQSMTPTGGPFVAGTLIQTIDSFEARNVFNGVDMGMRSEFFYGDWSLEVLTKAAGGSLRREVTIAGRQEVDVPGAKPSIRQAGLFALASNSGDTAHDTWDFVPELGATLGWDVTQHVRLRVGYSVLWLPEAARAGQQVDTNITPALIPPASATPTVLSRPAVSTMTSPLWYQNVNVGLEVRF